MHDGNDAQAQVQFRFARKDTQIALTVSVSGLGVESKIKEVKHQLQTTI